MSLFGFPPAIQLHTLLVASTSASMASIEEAAAWETRKRLVAGELENYLNT